MRGLKVAQRTGSSPSLDGASREAESYIAKLKKDGELDRVRAGVKHAKQSACPSAKLTQHVYSTGTKKAYEIPCGSWGCRFCGWKKQKVAAYLIFEGMLRAHLDGKRVRFLTLTEDPKRPMGIPDLSKAWNRLRTRLKDEEKLDEYASVVETTHKGRPHLHVVFTGDYVPQRKISSWAEKAGFGRVADIRQVDFETQNQEASKRAATYVAKELAGYVSKSKDTAEVQKAVKRRRPLRTSRGWYPGGMKKAEAELLKSVPNFEPDAGDFFFVLGRDGETLKVYGKTPGGEPFEMTDSVARVVRLPTQRRSWSREERRLSDATKKTKVARAKGKRRDNETSELEKAA